ncbi:UDP-N-acetylmuramoyl-tripeptide--D-alanyl-D-alanine ligase [bacterium]|nr:UDP-N-acetylmuramoyl-tripeptide--D-alanyl-D-alanine ligase [bacterium]
MKFLLEELIRAAGAEVKVNSADLSLETMISTDTRTIKKGDFYLPLKGESFDGEAFLDKAINAGACGCFITGENYPEKAQVVLKVNDTKEAYLKIANYARKKYNPKTIAITGSSGKTTTKEMVYAVCASKFKTQKTLSNHNNEIGCCQTILGMPEGCEVLIVEMGMRGFKEIEPLSLTAEPDIAIITNAGSAHIGRLGSLDNIAIAKCEITAGLKNDGILIANACERLRKFAKFEGEKLFYSINDVKILEMKAGYTKFEYKKEIYELNVEGEYNVENSLAAIEAGRCLGMSYEEIKAGLLTYKPIEKRWEVEEIRNFKVINDSYNANPESMKASVSTFVKLYENPFVILGDMGELGENEVEIHKSVGEYLAKTVSRNVKFLTVGKLSVYIAQILENSGFAVKSFVNNKDAALYIVENVNAGTTIFLKASRAMKFEEIISDLKGEIKL